MALKILREDTHIHIAIDHELGENHQSLLLNVIARKFHALTNENKQRIWRQFASTHAELSTRCKTYTNSIIYIPY